MKRIMTDEMHEFLLQNYKGISSAELTDRINKKFGTSFTVNQIKSYKAYRHLLSGFDGSFKKGDARINKKGHIHPGCEKSWFVKGNIPHNRRPVGSERINVYGFIEVKIGDSKWRLKHYLEWEKINGIVPENKVLIFLDGNKLNTDISNLKLISREERLIMNRYHLYWSDRDITDSATILAKLIDAKYKAKKQQQNIAKK